MSAACQRPNISVFHSRVVSFLWNNAIWNLCMGVTPYNDLMFHKQFLKVSLDMKSLSLCLSPFPIFNYGKHFSMCASSVGYEIEILDKLSVVTKVL